MKSPIKQLAGQTAIYGLSSILGRFLNYLLVPLYTSSLVFKNPSDYGVVAELYAWVAFVMVLLTFGMETAYFKFASDKDSKLNKVFSNATLLVLGINVLFLFVVVLMHQNIADALLYPNNPEYILLMAAILFVDATAAVPLAELRSQQRAKRFAIIQLSAIAINIGLNLLLLLVFFDNSIPEQGVRFILIANLIASLVKPIWLCSSFKKLTWQIDWQLAKNMLKYSFPLALAGLAYVINITIDRILLKHLTYRSLLETTDMEQALWMAEKQVGIYSASYKLALLITIFLQAYRFAAEPFFFAQSKHPDRNKVYVKVMNYFIGVVLFFFLIVALNIDIFKYFIPNEEYWEGLKVVPVLLIANVFQGIYINQSIWYKLSGQTKFGAYIAIGGAIITLSINFALIPIYGYMACAWATLIVYALQMIASYLLGNVHYPIPYNIRKFFLYFLVAISFFWIAKLLDLSFGWQQFITHNLLLLCFVGMVFWLENGRRKLT
ncbi:MAG: polysaccharide biosynthesis protein [Crocinitomicaceae bacterium]|nr:polysaccharide biosynthesis protein [Crocinitomicaceae bacterium]